MRNITVSVDDEVYRDARIWAAANDTSLSAAVEFMLENIRTILRDQKPPRQARRNNRYAPPPTSDSDCEELAQVLNDVNSMFSQEPLHSGTKSVEL